MLKGILSAISAKTVGIIAGAVAVVAAAGITAAVIFSGTDSYRVLKVFELNGSAAVVRESAGELDAYVGMNLESGDVITVNSGSVRLSLDNSKYVLLEEGTVLELVAEGTSTDSKTTLNLREGAILSEITESLSANSFYEVNVPKSTMAVRGTSFRISLIKLTDGSYIADISTFHGRVAVQLYNEDGSKKGGEVIVGENRSAKIKTEDTGSKNPEIDGKAYFVIVDPETGEIVAVSDGEDPVFDTDYSEIPEEVIRIILNSDEIKRLELSEPVLEAIRGNDKNVKQTSAASETSAPVTSAEKTEKTSAETTVPESTLLPPQTENEVNTSPETEGSTAPEIPNENPPITETSVQTTAETTVKTTAVTTTAKKSSKETTKKTTTAAETSKTTTTAEETSKTTTTTTTTVTESAAATAGTSASTASATTAPTMTPAATTGIKTPPTTSETAEYLPEVVFQYDDGEEVIIQINVGETLSEIPAVPEKHGYTGKWMFYENGEPAEFTAGTVIMEDTVVWVMYQPNEYMITFSVDGTIRSNAVGYYDSCLSENEIPEVPAKEHYTGKWVYNDEEFTSETVISGNMNVTAKYEPTKYAVKYVAGYDETVVIGEETVPYGGDVPRITIPDSYVTVDNDGDGSMNYIVWKWEDAVLGTVSGDTVISVPYIDYNSVYEIRVNLGTRYIQTLLENGDEFTLPDEPENRAEKEADGYVFVNWSAVSGNVESSKPGRSIFKSKGMWADSGETITINNYEYCFEPNYIMVDMIKISCDASTFVKGEVYTLNARYAKDGRPDTAAVYEGDIEWSVIGVDSGGVDIDVKSGTSISADGVLTVAADETAVKLRITAKSTKYSQIGMLTLPVST